MVLGDGTGRALGRRRDGVSERRLGSTHGVTRLLLS